MKPRSERRREQREGRSSSSVFGSRGLLAAALLGAGATAIIVAVVLLIGGDDDDDGEQVQSTENTPISLITPSSEDEIALEALARQSIEALPNDSWADLYPKFTDEFRSRCSREDFVATGDRSAEEQGDSLNLIRYAGVEEYNVAGSSARLVVVGEVVGTGQYTIGANFEKVGDEWLIAPVPGSSGCDAFERLSG